MSRFPQYDPAVVDDATAQALYCDGPDRLDDPWQCDICGESLPRGERLCPDCRAEPVPRPAVG